MGSFTKVQDDAGKSCHSEHGLPAGQAGEESHGVQKNRLLIINGNQSVCWRRNILDFAANISPLPY